MLLTLRSKLLSQLVCYPNPYFEKPFLVATIRNLSSWPVRASIGVEEFNGAGVIKFLEKQICVVYKNSVHIASEGDSKFDNAAARYFTSHGGIIWIRISA